MLLDEGMDTGPVLAQQEVPLRGDETGGGLVARLFHVGATLLIDTLERYERGEAKPVPQDETKATVTKLLSREDGEIEWSQAAERIARMVRAYDPWPGTHTRWRGQVLKVLEARGADTHTGAPGEVSVRDGELVVATGEGSLRVGRLQVEGRRELTAAEFLRGHPEFARGKLPS
jgi:methionyl-tRNA formyltransferase